MLFALYGDDYESILHTVHGTVVPCDPGLKAWRKFGSYSVVYLRTALPYDVIKELLKDDTDTIAEVLAEVPEA